MIKTSGEIGRVNMEICEVPEAFPGETFEEVFSAMQTDKYWINFFVRPCCPPPSTDQAKQNLDKRRDEVREHPVFSDEEKEKLLAIIDEREKWYSSSPFCRG